MSTDSPRGALAAYIYDECFVHWKEDRQQLDEKWQRNLDAFNAVSNGTWKQGEGEGWRSDTFLNTTKMKVVSAYSLVIDMLLQGNQIPFAMEPSDSEALARERMPEEEREGREDAGEKQEALIRTQLADCNADRAMMKHVLACAVYGETYAKRNVQEHDREEFQAVCMAPQGVQDDGRYTRYEKIRTTEIGPGWLYLPVWEVFRDLETNDLQKGRGVIHREFMSPYELRQLVKQPGFIPYNIGRVIKNVDKQEAESGKDSSLPPHLRDLQHREKKIEYLEFWGRVPRRIVEEFMAGMDEPEVAPSSMDDPEKHDGDEMEVLVCLANKDVVRFVPREPGRRPFYRAEWEMKLDGIGAVGIPDNMEEIQGVLNGSIRAFEDNKKLAANVLLAIKEEFIDGDLTFEPGKPIRVSDDVDDVRLALQQVVIQDVGDSLISVIRLFERYADMASMVPQIVQGQKPEKSTDTAYELSQLLENAGKYLGGVVRNFDEGLIEPIVTDFYNYNMMNPDADTAAKGCFKVKAQGFSSFQARIVRVQTLQRFMAMALGNELTAGEVNTRNNLEETAKGMDLDPSQALKSEEQKQEDSLRLERAKEQAKAEAAQELEMKAAVDGKIKMLEHKLTMAENEQQHRFKMEEEGMKLRGEAAKEEDRERRTMAGEMTKSVIGQQVPETRPAA